MKLEKIFAQPFVGTLLGHTDGISVIRKCPSKLQSLVSGSFDGEVRIWDISTRNSLVKLNGHGSIVKGVCFNMNG